MNKPASSLEEALAAIRWLKSRLRDAEESRHEPIAVVGLACRFPGEASTPKAFWELLARGEDAVREVPPGRWDVDRLYDPDAQAPGKIITRRGGFLSSIDTFDAEFFGIAPVEATAMDPQQRLMLEVAYEAFESAGIPLEELARVRTAVFVGVSWSDYLLRSLGSNDVQLARYSGTGTANSIVPHRVSYAFDLKGPSVAVDTACSSSLVAAHLACDSLRTRQSDVVLVGGVNAILHPFHSTALSKMGALSPDGRCKTFDASANGYVRGEGCGALVLKRLSDARADGDRIWAVIRGSAINQDGRSSGLTAPNMLAQVSLIEAALESAGLPASALSYVEAHGTGTVLGDLIEAEALAAVMQGRAVGDKCAVGSVKTNIGHLESAAGVASLIKVVLALHERRIPPSLHFRDPNPQIPFASIPLRVQTELADWPNGERPRVAGVSAFSIGGANAHAILSEAEERKEEEEAAERLAATPATYVVPISARSAGALAAAAEKWATHLAADEKSSLRDIAFTAATRRSHFTHRLAVVAGSKREAAERLRAFVAEGAHPAVFGGTAPSVAPKLAFVFSGQGAQSEGMASGLLEAEPVFRAEMERIDAAVRKIADWSILETLSSRARLEDTEIAQPVLFAIQASLAALLRSWGVTPDSVVGHSVGEIAAAYVSGALDLDQAVRLAVERGRIMQRTTGNGRMAAVALTRAEVEELVAREGGALSLAAVNGPKSCVLSGAPRDVDQVVETLVARGVWAKRLSVPYAFHSPQMEAPARELAERLSSLAPVRTTIPMISTCTGKKHEGNGLDASYWAQQMRRTVLFADAIESLARSGHHVFLEIGPHPVLVADVLGVAEVTGKEVTALASLRRGQDDRASLLGSVGQIHCAGVTVDWKKQFSVRGRVVDLPTYPWQRERYWIEDQAVEAPPVLALSRRGEDVWEIDVDVRRLPFLAEHALRGTTVLPGALCLAMALTAASEKLGATFDGLRDVVFVRARPFAEDETLGLRVALSGSALTVTCGDDVILRAVVQVAPSIAREAAPPIDPLGVEARCPHVLDRDAAYARLASNGVELGKRFRRLDAIRHSEEEALARLRPSSLASEPLDACVDPVLLDQCFQVLAPYLQEGKTELPASIGLVRLEGDPRQAAWVHARVHASARGHESDVVLLDGTGRRLLSLERYRSEHVEVSIPDARLAQAIFRTEWRRLEPAGDRALDGTWLVFADGRGVADALVSRMSGANVVVVRHGDELDPQRPEHFERLLAGIEACAGVVFCWPVDAGTSIDEGERLGCVGMLHLARALVSARWRTPPRLWVVTSGARRVEPGETIAIAQAPVWGFGASLATEAPDLACTLVDVDTSRGDVGLALHREIASRSAENRVALRGDERFGLRLVRAPRSIEPKRVRVRSDGTYLVTGGLSGLGLATAEWLVAEGARALLLVARSAPSEAASRAIASMAAEGAEIDVVRADVASRSDMKTVAEQLSRMPPLLGVVHSAGLVSDGTVGRLTARDVYAVFAPKVRGALHLHELAQGKELDFFVLYSSLAGIIGPAGQSNYAAANAFLDALAEHRESCGLPGASIAWGPWGSVGMAARAGADDRMRGRGFSPIEPHEGVALFARLGAEKGVHAAAFVDFRQWFETTPTVAHFPLYEKVAPRATEAPPSRDRARNAVDQIRKAKDPVSRLGDLVRTLVARTIRKPVEKVEPTTPLMQMGLDSLMSLDLRNQLERELGMRVLAAELYNNPTIDALARFLARELALDAPEPTERGRAAAPSSRADEPIAIVGMACRFPGGASSLERYWSLLENGIDAIREVPADRWDADAHYDPDPEAPGKMITKWGGFLDSIADFDAKFFRISPREALAMDPQQRLALETTWEAIVNSGHTTKMLSSVTTGVFIGVGSSEYGQRIPDEGGASTYAATGTALSIVANRISYVFDFDGPSAAVDTACSSSLVALHMACQSLRSGESDVMIAGGVNAMVSPKGTVTMSKITALSPDGRCKTFDARANGYVRGEGCGIVVLKRLSDALRDGDRIWALVKGTAIGQDGASTGLTAPNGRAQERVIERALRAAGVSPSRVSYVEAHGTGTALGDPVEAIALGRVLARGRAPGDRCVVGSVKANIGHLEWAAGIAGLIKVVLAMHRGCIPPQIHFEHPNPNIPFDTLPLLVSREAIPWPSGTQERICGVSSFGFGGALAHAVVAEPPRSTAAPRPAVRRPRILRISAKSADALHAYANVHAEHLEHTTDESFPDLCYTAAVRQDAFDHRLAVVAEGPAEARAKLSAFARGDRVAGLATGRAKRSPGGVAFVFTGQGPQWWGMGRELSAEEEVYRDALSRCDEIVRARADFSVLEELSRDEATSRLARTDVAQVAIVSVQIALAELWRSWGIVPSAVTGHSVGEISAAHVAGILSLEEAIALAIARGRLVHHAAGLGRMASVELPLDEAQALLRDLDGLSIAAHNAPNATVLSGDAKALERALERVRSGGRLVKELGVDYAFHSAQMDAFVEPLERAASRIEPRASTVPVVSTVTGRVEPGERFDCRYWGKQLRATVLFARAVESLHELGVDAFVEIGPHPVLSSSVAQTLHARGESEPCTLASLRRGHAERATMLESLAVLHCRGHEVNWSWQLDGRRVVDLPPYPWRRERFWLEEPASRGDARSVVRDGVARPAHPLLAQYVAPSDQSGTHVWESTIDVSSFPYLRDHSVHGSLIAPGMLWVAMALAAGAELYDERFDGLAEVSFEKVLELTGSKRVQVLISSASSGAADVRISSRPAQSSAPWELHARAKIVLRDGSGPAAGTRIDPSAIRARCTDAIDGPSLYERLRALGIELGPHFQACKTVSFRANEALGELSFAPGTRALDVHPALLDASFHALAAVFPDDGVTFLPTAIARVRTTGSTSHVAWSHARVETAPEARTGDIVLAGDDGTVVVDLRGVTLRRVARTTEDLDPKLFESAWRPASPPARSPRLEGTVVVVEDSGGLARRLGARLEARGAEVVYVRKGARFEAISPREIAAPLGVDAAAWDSVFEAIASRGLAPCRHVVHLHGLDTPASPSPRWDEILMPGSHVALHVVQSLVRRGGDPSPRLWLVTRNARRTGAGGKTSITQAALWGVGAVIAREHPELSCTMVDLDEAADADLLLDVVLSADRHERIAIRDKAFLVERLVPARSSAYPWAQGSSKILVRPDATYVVTGGLGGLGLVVADWLGRRGARHLVLVGRNPPSAQAQQLIAKIDADVRVARADVSDADAVAAALRDAASGLPKVRGIFHCAGVVDDAALTNMTPERFRAVMTKATGAWNLHRSFARQELDCFVLFSSAAGMLGSPGQSNYAAANAVLDALAHHRRESGLPATSIGWGPWSEVGMAARAKNAQSYRGIEPLSPSDGTELLEKILRSGHEQVLAMGLDANGDEHGLGELPLLAELRKAASPKPVGGKVDVRRRLVEAPVNRRPKILEGYLQGVLAKILGIPAASLERATPLAEYGFDSLMVVSLRVRIEADAGLSISPAEIFANASVARLARALSEKLDRPRPATRNDGEAVAGGLADTTTAQSTTTDTVTHELEERLRELEARGHK